MNRRQLIGLLLVSTPLLGACTSSEGEADLGGNSATNTVPAEPTEVVIAESTSEPSPKGGVGNTRADVYAARGKPDRTDILGSVAFADYPNASAGFVLFDGKSESDRDRLMDLLLYAPTGSFWTLDKATAIAQALLPSDAVAQGNLSPYLVSGIFMDYRQRFHSQQLAEILPGNARVYCGQDNPDIPEPAGTVWVRLNPPNDYAKEIKDIHVTTQGCG